LVRDALIGGALGGVFWGADQVVMRAAFRGTYVRYVAEGEIRAIQETGLLRGGRPGRTYFTTDRFERAGEALSRLALRQPPEYRVEFRILNQPRIHGPQRVRPWIRPLKPGFRAGFGVEYWSEEPLRVKILQIKQLQ